MSELPSYTPAEILAMKRAGIAEKPCPWCGAAAWDAGALTATIQMDRMANTTFTNGMTVPIVQQFVFTCANCSYCAAFAAGQGEITVRF